MAGSGYRSGDVSRVRPALRSAVTAIAVSLAAGPSWSQSSPEEELIEAELSIHPAHCVALHQGQVCYQNIRIEWSAGQEGDYCLYWALSEQPLQCWDASSAGEFEYDFQSPRSVTFSLRASRPGGGEIDSEMRVAWVHKARKRRRLNWRLF